MNESRDSTPVRLQTLFWLQLQFLTKIRGLCIWAIQVLITDINIEGGKKALTEITHLLKNFAVDANNVSL